MSEKFKASATCGTMKLDENQSPVIEYEIKLSIIMNQKQDMKASPEEAEENDRSLKEEMFAVIDAALDEAWEKSA